MKWANLVDQFKTVFFFHDRFASWLEPYRVSGMTTEPYICERAPADDDDDGASKIGCSRLGLARVRRRSASTTAMATRAISTAMPATTPTMRPTSGPPPPLGDGATSAVDVSLGDALADGGMSTGAALVSVDELVASLSVDSGLEAVGAIGDGVEEDEEGREGMGVGRAWRVIGGVTGPRGGVVDDLGGVDAVVGRGVENEDDRGVVSTGERTGVGGSVQLSGRQHSALPADRSGHCMQFVSPKT